LAEEPEKGRGAMSYCQQCDKHGVDPFCHSHCSSYEAERAEMDEQNRRKQENSKSRARPYTASSDRCQRRYQNQVKRNRRHEK
jgi:hypothetical protein